ncbi:hypothetical protein, conserved [Leishmania tarentolae]|uniref:Uncharacterized protein n=1 Tax=Leishmania tarentolae TaxID=5689 RepID=A0A640KU64_LEITA|nr:hypothetical protein, conserved [Leishmania tarentolae]
MFADLLTAASPHPGDRSSDVGVVPASSPFSPYCTSISSSTRSSSRCHRRRLSVSAEDGLYPRVSPLVGAATLPAHTDDRVPRPGSPECRSPFSTPDGRLSSTTPMASPSSGRPEVHSLSLGGTSVPPPRRSSGGTLGNGLEGDVPTSDPSSLSHHTDNARSPSLYDQRQKAPGVASSTPSHRATSSIFEVGASPALESMEASADDVNFIVVRSGTREGGRRSPELLSSSKSSSPSSKLCVPPLEHSTTGAVVVEKHSPSLRTSASPLRFSVLYTEEEHRVLLETRETEERRCLYQAHKAILSVYRMWAAASTDADYGDGDRLLLTSSRMGEGASTQLLEGHCYPKISKPLNTKDNDSMSQSLPLSTATAPNAVAAELVRSFLKSSIDTARDRRCFGVGQEGGAGACVLPQRCTAPRITYASSETEARRGSPGYTLHPQASDSSSPAASRMLDYSSMQIPETSSSLMHNSSEQPSWAHQTHLFSPWRTSCSDQHGVAARRAEGKTDVHLEPRKTQADSRYPPQRRPRTSLVPHLVSTSPAAVHLSSASNSLRASPVAHLQRSQLEPWLWADTAATCQGLSRSGTLPSERVASATRAWSPSSRAFWPTGEKSFSSPSAAQTEGRGVFRATSGAARNASVNLVSTSAASLHRSPFADDDATAGRDVGGTLCSHPNEAFHHGPLPAVSGTISGGLRSSPDDRTNTCWRTSLTAKRVKDNGHEGLSTYAYYKRFFDAVYGEQNASPSLLLQPAAQQSTLGRTSPAPPGTVQTSPSVPFYLGDGEKHVSAWSRRSPLSSSPYARTRSPELVARCELRQISPQGSTEIRSAPRSLFKAPTASCAWTTGDAAPLTVSADATLFAARLTRLSTLETLCRAELQRRCIEDQSLLLHHFIVEGTATLKRGGRETASLHQH